MNSLPAGHGKIWDLLDNVSWFIVGPLNINLTFYPYSSVSNTLTGWIHTIVFVSDRVIGLYEQGAVSWQAWLLILILILFETQRLNKSIGLEAMLTSWKSAGIYQSIVPHMRAINHVSCARQQLTVLWPIRTPWNTCANQDKWAFVTPRRPNMTSTQGSP